MKKIKELNYYDNNCVENRSCFVVKLYYFSYSNFILGIWLSSEIIINNIRRSKHVLIPEHRLCQYL